jgi:hypothetical protein
MATERQIAANQRNAKRSTGPRTTTGKKMSSRNSYKHGLSLALLPDGAMRDRMELLVRQAAGPDASNECIEAATDFATAYHEIQRVRDVQNVMLTDQDPAKASPEQLDELIATNRYERRAFTKQRRASAKLRRLLGV